MAGVKQFANGTWQYTFKRTGVLEKPIYLTFNSREEGDEYARKLEALLDAGIVPTELRPASRILTIQDLVDEYVHEAHPSPKDRGALSVTARKWGDTPLRSINSAWVDDWIAEIKRVEKLAPATIRARVGALARCADWGMRKNYLVMPDHPLRTLPDGYAQYSKADIQRAGVKRQDEERDRRLEPGEHERIVTVIETGVLPRKQRPLPLKYPDAYRCLYVLALESAMRLREMYTIRLDQLVLPKRTIFLDKTKNGDKRQVPLSSIAMGAIEDYLQTRTVPKGHDTDLLFPWWNGVGNSEMLGNVSDQLSKTFKAIFEQAGASGLRFHDLRHEATSRLFERTSLSETQIMKITGHKSHRMLMRYANLRGSDLARALWLFWWGGGGRSGARQSD